MLEVAYVDLVASFSNKTVYSVPHQYCMFLYNCIGCMWMLLAFLLKHCPIFGLIQESAYNQSILRGSL